MKHGLSVMIYCVLSSIGFAQDSVQENPLQTTIEFEESEYNFGDIHPDERVSHVFRFSNTGDHPLIITKAIGSCGCTVPYYSKVPIMPGESSEIEVEFDTTNKKNQQSKRVTVYGNIESGMTHLRISANVVTQDQADNNEEVIKAIEKRNEVQGQIEKFDANCFAIFPNPTNQTLQLELREHIGKSALVEIRNEIGTKMHESTIQSISRQTTRFDVSSYAAGVYLISIRVEGGAPITQCFVVSR